MLTGLCALLAPEFDLVAVATPFAEQFIRRGPLGGILALLGVDDVGAMSRGLVREGITMARAVSALPKKLEHVLEHAERGELRLIIESTHFGASAPARAGQRVGAGLLNRQVPAWVPLGVMGLALAAMFVRRRGARE
jgi:hypothetical protein